MGEEAQKKDGRKSNVPNGGRGRPPGIPNKTTQTAREAIARLVESSTPMMQQWLQEIYETKGPDAAWKCLTDVMEYHLPKIQRVELTGGTDEEGKDKPVTLNFVLHTPTQGDKS